MELETRILFSKLICGNRSLASGDRHVSLRPFGHLANYKTSLRSDKNIHIYFLRFIDFIFKITLADDASQLAGSLTRGRHSRPIGHPDFTNNSFASAQSRDLVFLPFCDRNPNDDFSLLSYMSLVYKIPYRRARAWPSGCLKAECAREQSTKVSCIQG